MSVDAPLYQARLRQLSLPALRAYRQLLRDEEHRVSYWRRLLQGRLDLVAAGRVGGQPLAVAEVQRILAQRLGGSRHAAMIHVAAAGELSELPGLGSLWETELTGGTTEATATTISAVAEAESQLSTYRASLHRLLDLATAELVRRYQDDPARCLDALPAQECRLAAGS